LGKNWILLITPIYAKVSRNIFVASKQMAFDHLSQKQVNKAVALLNNQPSKSPDYQTP
jgi:IS30 family transposase